MKRVAAEYELFLGQSNTIKLDLQHKPVFRWTNPIQKSKDGVIFIWTHQGRPEAMVGVFTYDKSRFSREFQSVSRSSLVAVHKKQPVWHPSSAGVERKAVPDAPTPAASIRQRQMKALPGRFTASVGKNKHRRKIRLLTQPIYRYEPKDSKLRDGALLAFVQGTDPELLLLLEAWPDGTNYESRYGLARMISVSIEARYRNQVV